MTRASFFRVSLFPLLTAAVALVTPLCPSPSFAQAPAKTKIVLIAGVKSHPSGQHEFRAGGTLLTRALNEQSGLPVNVVLVTEGWPKDETVFDGAKAVICYADGGGKHPFVGHLDKVDALAKAGVGIMCMHYGVEVVPDQAGKEFTRWIGGYYAGGYSVNPHWDADTEAAKDHPVGRGVNPVKVNDEWYFRMRFPEPPVHSTLLKATPTRAIIKRYIHWNDGADPELGKPQSLMWGMQRPDGGRGVGFTGGHWHRNWAIDDFRKVVLNAIVWTAGLEVPEGGVKSLPITEAQLNENLDEKTPMVQVKLPSPEDFNTPTAEPVGNRGPGVKPAAPAKPATAPAKQP
ncbi:trehalose utilization protein [Roseimicrobium gellanilyticum]|uniref:Trehalose utilization protein n=1 Tax=Roseimicrobium gellanilyticum TaxID=748857 RepID=A0A366HM38_9BACT|nr:ThuA domain-containing protein [Roseimicrobium gellanilyticum]RBP44209.1 trehalose utilization protein [Roseimicrobium gellanilyticum]